MLIYHILYSFMHSYNGIIKDIRLISLFLDFGYSRVTSTLALLFTNTYKNIDSVTLLGEYLEENGKETPFCSII